MQDPPERQPHLVSRGMLATSWAAIALGTIATVVMPGRPIAGWPLAALACAVLVRWLAPRAVRLGHGTDSEVSISPSTAILAAAVLLVPPFLLPVLVALRIDRSTRGWQRDVVNTALDVVTVLAASGAAALAWAASDAAHLPAAVATAVAALAASAAWWLASSLGMTWVLWRALHVPPSLSPVIMPSSARLLGSQLVLATAAVVLLRASAWNLPVVLGLVWLLHRFADDQRRVHTAGDDRRTGMPRYEVFLEAAERELARSVRTGGAVSVLMIDLDHFRAINSEHGHAAGDVVLGEVARRVRGTLRITDIAGRYGGEEFCVLLPDTAADRAVVVGERIRAEVGSTPVQLGPGDDAVEVGVTTTIGAAQMLTGENVQDALERADRVLFEAKEAGRDRVALAVDLHLR